MQDPTSVKFLKTQRLMRSGAMVGQDRPIGRVTWAKGKLHGVTSDKAGVGTLRYLDRTAPVTELFGVRTIEIDRSIGQDAGTCTITLWNTRPNYIGPPEGVDTEGFLGYLSPTRGQPHPVPTHSVYDQAPNEDAYDGGIVGSFIKYPTTWQYSGNAFRDVLIPNTVLRTYQGYGSDNLDTGGNPFAPDDDNYVAPQSDQQLFWTGVWLIDKVTFGSDGTVSVECRDLAKVLIEQFVYPPMLPMSRFPLIYNPAHAASGHKESVGPNVAKYHSSSVDAKHGHNAAILGHRGSDAFDNRSSTFWLTGQNQDKSGVEWIQAITSGSMVNEVALDCPHGNYVAYVSIYEGGHWQGTSTVSGSSENLSSLEGGSFFYVIAPGDTLWDLAYTYYGDHFLWPRIAKLNQNIIKDPHWIYPGQRIKIPYIKGTKSPPPDHVNGATAGTHVSVPYVVKVTVPSSGKVTIKLPRTYKATYVRVVFTNLYRRGTNDYRADCRTMVARNHITNTYKASTINRASYITDWVEPVKEMLAWAGFTYFNPVNTSSVTPDPLTGRTKNGSGWLKGPGDVHTGTIPTRVWGDFEYLGAGPVVSTPGDYFVSKSFREAIQLIVDFIGAIFWVDETGGAQFRLPNIWGGGNFVADPSAPVTVKGYLKNTYPIEFHEDANLTNYQAVISDEAVRSEVLVVGGYPNTKSTMPIAGGTVLGYDPATNTTSAIDFTNVLAGQYRLTMIPGDSTKLFTTQAECQRTAELTALFIMFTYRQGSLTAPCHPALQIDDQVRIYERVTSESFVHYVSSIKTTQDLEAGSYVMDVQTHWLGSDPNTDWFANKLQLTPAVLSLPAVLARLGKQAPADSSLPVGSTS